MERSRASARRALSGMEWLFPEGGPFRVPVAEIIGVLPFALGMLGVVVGLARMPIGVVIAGTADMSAAAGTAIFATQRARRPEWFGYSQDTVVLDVGVVRSGGLWRRRAQATQISEREAAPVARCRLSERDSRWRGFDCRGDGSRTRDGGECSCADSRMSMNSVELGGWKG